MTASLERPDSLRPAGSHETDHQALLSPRGEQALSSPVSGLLGDRFDRCHLVAGGCLLWGVMTAAVGLSNTLPQAMVSCACAG